MPGIELSHSAHILVVLLTIAIALAIVYFSYRTTLPPVSSSRRITLVVLRVATFCTLGLLLFQPLLRLVLHSTDVPVLAVLVDNSRSMRLIDGTGSRAVTLRNILTSGHFRVSQDRATADYFTFGVHPRPATGLPDDTLSLNEDATDIAAAIRLVAAQKDQMNIQGVLLLTDGVYSLGQNPLYDAEQLGIPVYAVGIGDSAEQKDISIIRVATNDVVFGGTQTPVDVTIRSSGFGGERIQVNLLGEGKELDRRPLLVQSGTREYTVHLSYIPEGSGQKTFAVTIPPLPEEVTPLNNRHVFSVRVLKSALRVLVVAGAPGPDVSIVRQTISEQPNLIAQSFTEKADGGFYEGSLSQQVTDSADCLVLINIPTSTTPHLTLDRIVSLLHDRAVPLLYIGGHAVDFSKLATLGPEIPFTVSSTHHGEETVLANPEPAQRGNPLLEIGDEMTFESWSRLPPIYRVAGTYRARPEALILVTSTLQQVPTTDPLILARTAGREKTVAIAGYGIWRWRLTAQGDDATKNMLSAFLHATIRWLTTPVDVRRFIVSPTKDNFAEGEGAEFIAQLYGATAEPLDDAQIRVVVHEGNRAAESDLQSMGSGRYSGSIEGLREGMYSYRATATWRGGATAEDTGSFRVGVMDLEFRDTRMNIDLLRQLAYRTGGMYFSPDQISRFDSTAHARRVFAPRQRNTVVEVELWHWRYLLVTLLVLLAVEWFLRKWHGML